MILFSTDITFHHVEYQTARPSVPLHIPASSSSSSTGYASTATTTVASASSPASSPSPTSAFVPTCTSTPKRSSKTTDHSSRSHSSPSAKKRRPRIPPYIRLISPSSPSYRADIIRRAQQTRSITLRPRHILEIDKKTQNPPPSVTIGTGKRKRDSTLGSSVQKKLMKLSVVVKKRKTVGVSLKRAEEIEEERRIESILTAPNDGAR